MRTVKNRKRKFALGMKIAAMFSCIAIASVGFAAWIIVSKPEDKIATGTITASTVSDKGLTLTANTAMDGVIVLDAPQTQENDKWLTSDSVTTEQPRAVLKVKLDYTGITKATISVSLKAQLNHADNPDAEDRLAALLGTATDAVTTDDYVTVTVSLYKATGVDGANIGDKIVSGTQNTFACTYNFGQTVENVQLSDIAYFYVVVEFTWGPAFGGNNPYTYFNDLPETTDNKLKARTALTAIYNAIYGTSGVEDDLTYHVTISATSTDIPTTTP